MNLELDVEAEVHYVAVADGVFFAFDVHFAGVLDGRFRTECHEVVVFDYFGSDETFFEVGMYNAGGLRGFCAAQESPCPDFVGACGEVCLEVEQGVCGTDESVHSALFEAH